MKNRFIVFLILGIFLINFISASCTVTLDKDVYVAGETATVAMACSTNPEKNTPYNVNWTNSSGYQFELDYGTTPSVAGQLFYQSYTIPTDWPNGIWINLSINGTGLTPVNNDSANVTSFLGGGTNALEITNTTFGGGYLGLVSSIKAIVTDEGGKKISGGNCKVSGLSNDETKVLLYQTTPIFNGYIEISDIMPVTRFDEGTDYAYKVDCYCGSNVSGTECIDEDGNHIENSLGTAKNFFTTQTWLTVNTVTDKSNYNMKNEIFICANVTNVNYSKRIDIPIYYEVRCSSEMDNNGDLDRILIIDDSPETIDERGINTNTTQMQCKKFVIPELNYLQGKTSQCYASTKVEVLNSMSEPILSYLTTSPIFNITSTELNLDPDWQWVEDKTLNSIVNLSDFTDLNGTGTGDIDVRLTDSINDRIYVKDSIEIFNLIANVTIYNMTDLLTKHTDYELEFLEDGQLEIEIRNVPLTKTGTEWYNITLDFYDLNLRQTSALEGINNKTGTFHLDVDCPSTGIIGSDMNCVITAYVEDSQIVQKEVDFTCYISDGLSEYSSVNFNQMITKTAVSINRSFTIPSTFNSGQQYVLQCHADYYNLGSRRDSFYDTFITNTEWNPSEGTMAGKAVEELPGEKETEEKEEGIKDFIDKFNPFSPKRNWLFIIGEIISLIVISFLIYYYINKKRKHHVHIKGKNIKNIFAQIFIIFIGLIILVAIIFIIIYGFNYLKDNLFTQGTETNITESKSYFIFQDSLFRGIILSAFIISMIIILFKSLNVRGEIKFGRNDILNRYDKKIKEQMRINKKILKQELKNLKRK